MDWTEVSNDPTTGETTLVCEIHCPKDEHIQDFYNRINATYSDMERHWRQLAVMLVRRKKPKLNKK